MYGRKYMGIVRSAFLDRREGQDRRGLVQDQPRGHPEEPARGARPVDERARTLTPPAAPDVLPHRPPFLFVDAVTALVPGESATRDVAADGRGVVLRRATSPGGRRCPAC